MTKILLIAKHSLNFHEAARAIAAKKRAVCGRMLSGGGSSLLLLAMLNGFVISLAHDTGPAAGPKDNALENQTPLPDGRPSSVRLIGRLDPFQGNNRYGDVWGDGNYAYIGSYVDETVGIIDISNPATPKLVSTYKGGFRGLFEDMQVKGGIAYFASYSSVGTDASGLHIVDVSNPAAPVLLKRLTAQDKGFNSIHNVFLDGHYLYEADAQTPTVKVFDVSTPSAPVFVRDIRTTDLGLIHDMTVINNRLYTSGWGGNTDIYDVTNIAQEAPKLLGTLKSGSASHSSWVSQDGKILATCSESEAKDLRLYDIADPKKPKLLTRITSGTLSLDAISPHNPVIMGDLLFVSWYQAGVQVFNIKDPARPTLVGAFDTFAGGILTPGGVGSEGAFWDGCWGVYPLLGLNKVLLSDLDNGLFIVDATKLNEADSDGDLLPDTWETQHGLDPKHPADALTDADGDGASNRDEFFAGTNPRRELQTLRMIGAQKAGSNINVSFAALDGRVYRVERNNRLAKDGWELLRDEVQGTNGVATVVHTNGSRMNMQFYRALARP